MSLICHYHVLAIIWGARIDMAFRTMMCEICNLVMAVAREPEVVWIWLTPRWNCLGLLFMRINSLCEESAKILLTSAVSVAFWDGKYVKWRDVTWRDVTWRHMTQYLPNLFYVFLIILSHLKIQVISTSLSKVIVISSLPYDFTKHQ